MLILSFKSISLQDISPTPVITVYDSEVNFTHWKKQQQLQMFVSLEFNEVILRRDQPVIIIFGYNLNSFSVLCFIEDTENGLECIGIVRRCLIIWIVKFVPLVLMCEHIWFDNKNDCENIFWLCSLPGICFKLNRKIFHRLYKCQAHSNHHCFKLRMFFFNVSFVLPFNIVR